MPAGKPHQSSKSNAGVRAKDKTFLDLNEINKYIQKSSPKYNDKLQFEIVFYVTAFAFVTFQYLHIYRLNFYNYDFKLYIYSLLILARRLLFKLKQEKDVSDPLKRETVTHIIKLSIYLWVFNVVYLTYQLFLQYTWSSILSVMYFHIMVILASFFLYKEQRYDNVINEITYLGKVAMFRSLEVIYFTFLLPLKCHDENLSYDLLISVYIGIMGLFNSTIWVLFFNVCYRCEEMRKQSKTLGDWKSINPTEKEKQLAEEWSLTRAPYMRNAIVYFGKKYYRAVSKSNAAVPGNLQFKLIYHVFHNHQKTRTYFIVAMCASIIIQNLILINSKKGTVYILILIESFFVFFFMIRLDRRLLRLLK